MNIKHGIYSVPEKWTNRNTKYYYLNLTIWSQLFKQSNILNYLWQHWSGPGPSPSCSGSTCTAGTRWRAASLSRCALCFYDAYMLLIGRIRLSQRVWKPPVFYLIKKRAVFKHVALPKCKKWAVFKHAVTIVCVLLSTHPRYAFVLKKGFVCYEKPNGCLLEIITYQGFLCNEFWKGPLHYQK